MIYQFFECSVDVIFPVLVPTTESTVGIEMSEEFYNKVLKARKKFMKTQKKLSQMEYAQIDNSTDKEM